MKIVTCIKQVRDLDLVLPQDWVIGPEQSVDISYANPIINTYDESAMEMMLRLADQDEKVETVAMTVGGQETEPMLKKALAVQVDQGVRIERRLDPLHAEVSEYLAKGIKRLGDVSLVLAGRQAGMNDHGQTGLLLAERLGWPCITLVTAVELRDGRLLAMHLVEEGVEEVEITGPVVLTIAQTSNCCLRMATLRNVLEAKKKTIHRWTEDELGMKSRASAVDDSCSIRRVYIKKAAKHCEMLQFDREQMATDRLLEEIDEVSKNKGASHDD